MEHENRGRVAQGAVEVVKVAATSAVAFAALTQPAAKLDTPPPWVLPASTATPAPLDMPERNRGVRLDTAGVVITGGGGRTVNATASAHLGAISAMAVAAVVVKP